MSRRKYLAGSALLAGVLLLAMLTEVVYPSDRAVMPPPVSIGKHASARSCFRHARI